MKVLSPPPQKIVFIHHLKSKSCFNRRILIITGYDYFLNKRDLKLLLNKFEEVFISSQKVDADYFFDESIDKILSKSRNIVIVFYPFFDNVFKPIHNFLSKEGKNIEIIDTYTFCENLLKKYYISGKITETTPSLNNLYYFGFFPRLFKKIIDVGVGSTLCILTHPLWLISFFRIRRESPGPVLFKQKRVGIRNREFTIVKFRSMTLDAEINGAQFSSKNDDRIFSYGKTMRRTRIDELPQLINIVKGELSLIGPRPERKVFTETFEEEIPHYNERHAVKPGISGYAQVMYNYGTGVSDARHKLMYDLYYIKNWSVLLELEIIFRTCWTIVAKKGL